VPNSHHGFNGFEQGTPCQWNGRIVLPFGTFHYCRVVLTGGGSQLNGVEQLAGEMLRCSVRIARPHRFEGLPDAMAQPGFAVASGLLRYGLVPDRQAANLGQLIAGAGHDAGYFRRVGQWLKESF
jgi:cell division protein FtsA